MILQTVRNECVRFGGHVDIEVSVVVDSSITVTS
jgi:hypothetical protein